MSQTRYTIGLGGVTIKKLFLVLIIILGLTIFSLSYSPDQDNEVIILTYHQISDDYEYAKDHPSVIYQKDFYQQMKYLSEENYQTLSLSEFYDYYLKEYFPDKSVMITFDDGYLCFYLHAYPILNDFGLSSVVFPIVSHRNDLQRYPLHNEHLSFHHLRLMDNVSYGSHTYDLHFIDDKKALEQNEDESFIDYQSRVVDDLLLSRLLLERQTDQKINSLAWPYGFYNDELIDFAKKAGFDLLFTLDESSFTPKMCLSAIPRFNITEQSLNDFINILN